MNPWTICTFSMFSFGGVDFIGENQKKKKMKCVIWHSSVVSKGEG